MGGDRQLKIVVGSVEICHAIWQGGEAERMLQCLHLQTMLAILGRQLHKRAVLVIAIVLRTRIVGKLRRHSALV